MKSPRPMPRRQPRRRTSLLPLTVVAILAGMFMGIWFGWRLLPGIRSASMADLSLDQQDDYVVLVAHGYAQSPNLDHAQRRLSKLEAPNPAQLVASVAERRMAAGGSEQEITALARLATALGVKDTRFGRYLATATPTTAPPTSTPAPTQPPAPTPEPSSPTPVAVVDTPTPQPTVTPSAPVAVAADVVNVRGGPDTEFPVIGNLAAGERAPILGRNQAGDWWQVRLASGAEGWVSAQIVTAEGDAGSIVVAANIPELPPTATPKPRPTRQAAPTQPPAPNTPTPKPGVAYVADVRLRSVGQDSQRCDGGENSIYVTVVDPAGNPINGVRVREVYTGKEFVTGDQGKGPGRVQYDIYRGGGGQVVVVDDAGNPIGAASRGMSADWPDFDLLQAAGYCTCKPHTDAASCQADLQNKTYFFAVGHYTYDVTFHRTY